MSSMKYFKEHPKKYKEHLKKCREYYEKNRTKFKEKQQKYYYTHQEEQCIKCRIRKNKERKEDRIIIIEHYSHGKNCCEICGISDKEVLTIDHINGGGRKHFIKSKGHIDRELIKNNFPDGYRILCMNCNFKEGKRKKFIGCAPCEPPINKLTGIRLQARMGLPHGHPCF